VALAGLLSASRLKGEALRDQRIVILGAGAGGIGVAWAITQGLIREGLSPEEARDRVCVLDSRGLLVEGRNVEAYKQPFVQPRRKSPTGKSPTMSRPCWKRSSTPRPPLCWA
jgi:malate dehydrogenase (oxaloacetate-decarboxylating)